MLHHASYVPSVDGSWESTEPPWYFTARVKIITLVHSLPLKGRSSCRRSRRPHPLMTPAMPLGAARPRQIMRPDGTPPLDWTRHGRYSDVERSAPPIGSTRHIHPPSIPCSLEDRSDGRQSRRRAPRSRA